MNIGINCHFVDYSSTYPTRSTCGVSGVYIDRHETAINFKFLTSPIPLQRRGQVGAILTSFSKSPSPLGRAGEGSIDPYSCSTRSTCGVSGVYFDRHETAINFKFPDLPHPPPRRGQDGAILTSFSKSPSPLGRAGEGSLPLPKKVDSLL